MDIANDSIIQKNPVHWIIAPVGKLANIRSSGGTTAIATHAGAMGPAAEWGPARKSDCSPDRVSLSHIGIISGGERETLVITLRWREEVVAALVANACAAWRVATSDITAAGHPLRVQC